MSGSSDERLVEVKTFHVDIHRVSILVALGWRKWAHDKTFRLEKLIIDPAFLVGQVLATVSCVALVPFCLLAVGRSRTLERAFEYGLIIAGISAFIGIFILPFGSNRAKWTSVAGCLLNLGMVFMFFLALGD
jgi:hypothetical protein